MARAQKSFFNNTHFFLLLAELTSDRWIDKRALSDCARRHRLLLNLITLEKSYDKGFTNWSLSLFKCQRVGWFHHLI